MGIDAFGMELSMTPSLRMRVKIGAYLGRYKLPQVSYVYCVYTSVIHIETRWESGVMRYVLSAEVRI